jgi:hypothetical protein
MSGVSFYLKPVLQNTHQGYAINRTRLYRIVTVNDNHAKIKLLVEGVEVQNQHLKCMDVEKEITNITIKYTPVELADINIHDMFCAKMHGSLSLYKMIVCRHIVNKDECR